MSNSSTSSLDLVFKGWIPTLAGSLTFDRFGHARFPSRSVGVSIGKATCRSVFCFQRRILKDGVIPCWALRVFYKTHSKFCFVAAGRVDQSDALSGHVYIFSYTAGPKETRWKALRQNINNKRNPAALLQRTYASCEGPVEWWESYQQQTHPSLFSKAWFVCDFTIERCGITTITVSKPEQFQPHLPTDLSERQKQIFDLANQVFFFLRDVTHAHQHHPETIDTMTGLYLATGNNPDAECLCQTAHHLFRFVVEYKQRRDALFCYASKGVIAYLGSLLTIIAQKNATPPTYEFRFLQQSLDTKISELDFRWRTRFHRVTVCYAPVLATLAFLLACGNLFRNLNPQEHVHPWLIFIGKATTQHFAVLFGCTAVVIIGVHYYIWGTDAFPASWRKFSTNPISRLLQALPRPTEIAVSLFISVLFHVLAGVILLVLCR